MTRSKNLLALCSALTCCAMLMACDSKKTVDKPTDSPEVVTPDDAPKEPVKEEIVINQKLMDALKAMATTCDVQVDKGRYTCEGDEEKNLKALIVRSPEQMAALDTLHAAMTQPDEKLVTVATSVLGRQIRSYGDKPTSEIITPATAKRLIKAMGETTDTRAVQISEAVAHAAAIAGELDALYVMLDGLQSRKAAQKAYAASARYGALNALPKLQELAKLEDKKERAAAFKGAAKIDLSVEEHAAKVCPWAKEFIEDARPGVYHGAGRVLLKCRGAHLDALLSAQEKRVEAGQFLRNDYMLFRDVCFSPVKALLDSPGYATQCDRTYAMLEKAANDERVESKNRGLALYAIYYQRRDEKTYALMKKYAKSKNEDIQQYAKDAIESLETHYMKKK